MGKFDYYMGWFVSGFFGLCFLKYVYAWIKYKDNPNQSLSKLTGNPFVKDKPTLIMALLACLSFVAIGLFLTPSYSEINSVSQSVPVQTQKQKSNLEQQQSTQRELDKINTERVQKEQQQQERIKQEELQREQQARQTNENLQRIATDFCRAYLEKDKANILKNVASLGASRTISDRELQEQLFFTGGLVNDWIDMTYGKNTKRTFSINNLHKNGNAYYFDFVIYSNNQPAVIASNIRMLETTNQEWAIDGESFLRAIKSANE